MTALSPLSYKRIRDVLSRYGEGVQLHMTRQPDPEAPWQPDIQYATGHGQMLVLHNTKTG